jgi:hypothetical protein
VANKVVARFLDGRVIKGISLDVDIDRPTCHIRTADQGTKEVKLVELKALFFVKDLAGNPAHEEGAVVDVGDARTRGAYTIAIKFADGERVVGVTVRYPPVRRFFYVIPADARSNNTRILVNRAAVKHMEQPGGPSSGDRPA